MEQIILAKSEEWCAIWDKALRLTLYGIQVKKSEIRTIDIDESGIALNIKKIKDGIKN